MTKEFLHLWMGFQDICFSSVVPMRSSVFGLKKHTFSFSPHKQKAIRMSNLTAPFVPPPLLPPPLSPPPLPPPLSPPPLSPPLAPPSTPPVVVYVVVSSTAPSIVFIAFLMIFFSGFVFYILKKNYRQRVLQSSSSFYYNNPRPIVPQGTAVETLPVSASTAIPQEQRPQLEMTYPNPSTTTSRV